MVRRITALLLVLWSCLPAQAAYFYGPRKHGHNYFGYGGLGNVTISSNTQLTSTTDGPWVVVEYDYLTVNAGCELTVSNRCKGLIIFVRHDLDNSGHIHMDGKGANAAGDDLIIPFFNLTSGVRAIHSNWVFPAAGEVGGTGSTSASGVSGGDGNNTGGKLTSGGGGAGAGYNGDSGSLSNSGSGAAGTSYAGGSGGGAQGYNGSGGNAGQNGAANAGAGGDAGKQEGGYTGGASGGGSGNNGGLGYKTVASVASHDATIDGGVGCGGNLLIIVGGNFVNHAGGKISADGIKSADVTYSWSPAFAGNKTGGASGAGHYLVRCAGTYTDSGTTQCKGGLPGTASGGTAYNVGGGRGGDGKPTVEAIAP